MPVPALELFRAEVPLPRASDPDVGATAATHFVNVYGKADWDVVNWNLVDEPLQHVLLNTTLMVLKEVFDSGGITVLSCTVEEN